MGSSTRRISSATFWNPWDADFKQIRRPVAVNTVALATLTVAFAASALAQNLGQLAALRFLTGVASGAVLVLTITITLERTSRDRHGLASGILWAGFGFGVVVSGICAPYVVGDHPSLSWRQTWLLMSLAGPIVATGFARAAQTVHTVTLAPSTSTAPAVLKRPSSGMLLIGSSYFLFGTGYITYFTYVIALVIASGFPAQFAGLLWSFCGLAGILGGVFAGRALDGRFAFVVLPVVLGIGALGAFLGVLASSIAIATGALLMGFSFLSTPATVSTLLKKLSTLATYPQVLSYVTAAFAVGQFLGPVVGGVVVDATSLRGGVVFSGILMCSATLLAIMNSLQPIRHGDAAGEMRART